MLRLIFGGAGSGKTTLLEDLIKKDCLEKKRSLLIVPEQQTVVCEKRMLDILPPSAQLDFEVLNFTRLANKAFRSYGGLTYRYISPGVKNLAMWNTLHKVSPLLSEYSPAMSDALSMTELMLSAVEEFKAYCVTPISLDSAAKRLLSENKRLAGKINDLSLVYAVYNEAVSEYGDGSDDLTKLTNLMKEHPFLENCNVYVDSFTSFTMQEYGVLEAIIRNADNLTLTVCSDVDCEKKSGQMQFEVSAQSVKKLLKIAKKQNIQVEKTVLFENLRAKNKSLKLLSEHLWRFDTSTPFEIEGEEGAVSLLRCSNRYEEAEAAANNICRLVREGFRYKDIVVVAREASEWEGIIDTAFEKAHIPFFMSHKTDITSAPLIKMLLCALRIKNNGWRTEDVITYIKTGLVTDSLRDSDLFEDYIWKWNIKGKAYIGDDWTMNPDSYSAELNEVQEKRLCEINRVRREITEPLSAFFDALDASGDNASMAKAVFDFLLNMSIPEKIRRDADIRYSRGEKKSAAEQIQFYNKLLELLDELAVFETEEKYSCREFENAFRAILSGIEIGTIPTSCDEIVVGSASTLRVSEPRCTILIGVNDGVFPMSVKENVLLSDIERKKLLEVGIELSGDENVRSAEELFYAYRAISSPTERLIVSYSASDIRGGTSDFKPSMLFNRIKLLLSLSVKDYSKLDPYEKMWSPNIAFEYATILGKSDCAVALREYFSSEQEWKEAYKALKIPVSQKECRLSKTCIDEFFGNQMSMSPSAFEKYVKCPFDYFCEYVLRLRPDERNEFRLNSTGSIIHAVLEKFIRSVTDENGFNAALAEEKSEELAEMLLSECAFEIIPSEFSDNERIKHTVRRLRSLSKLLVKSVVNEFKKSKFVPSFFELKISDRADGAVQPIEFTLKDGTKVTIGGIVDRVDLYRYGEDVYVKVVDYKTGSKNFKLSDVKEGINLQMLLYLQALCNNSCKKTRDFLSCGKDGELKPAGVVYLSSKSSPFSVESSCESGEVFEIAQKGLNRSGVVSSDENILLAIRSDGEYQHILSGLKKTSKTDKLKNEEEFKELFAELENTVVSVISNLRDGKADICPKKDAGRLPCEYCSMKAVCRRSVTEEENNEEVGEDGMD